VKNISIVFERDKGFVAAAIRAVTKYDSNHVAILYDSDDWETPWVLEATVNRGAQPFPARERKWTHAYQANPGCDLVPHIQSSETLIGQRYDFLAILLFGWLFAIWDYFKLKLFRPHWTIKGQMCSELVSTILNKQFPGTFEAPQWTSPAEISRFLESHSVDFEKLF
jgi:hypothetical protein